MEHRRRLLLICLVALVLAAITAVSIDMARRAPGDDAARTFQKAVGGLGIGAIAAPLWQFMNYDPRIMSVDDSITWPVPGGYSFGPDRTATVSSFQETPSDQWISREP